MSETKQLRWRLVEVTGEASSLRDSNQSSKVEIAALHDKVDTQVNENAKMRQLQNVVADDLRSEPDRHTLVALVTMGDTGWGPRAECTTCSSRACSLRSADFRKRNASSFAT